MDHNIAACNCDMLKSICLQNAITFPDVGKRQDASAWMDQRDLGHENHQHHCAGGIGVGTPGLTVHIPKSLFLANTVKNETNLGSDYGFHLMTIPIQADDNWRAGENALLDAAREICSPYLGDARRAMSNQAFQHSLEEPSIDPRIQVQVTGPDQYLLILR